MNDIVNLQFIPKDKIYAWLFKEEVPDDVDLEEKVEIKDLVMKEAGFSSDNLFKSIFLIVFAFIGLVILMIFAIWIKKKYYYKLPASVRKVFTSI